MAELEIQQLHKEFGGVIALHSLDLAVQSGEFVSLLGPSGCGKTTALRIIAGFERADGGRVLVDGKDISGVPANNRDMGMVFQSYSLFPNMTAQDNVAFGLRLRRVSKPERLKRSGDLLDMVGLAAAKNRYPHQLSGGQQQRVALARALAIEPRVLLLDEPLSALDALVRLQLREEIRRIQTRLGITALYVTHDQEEALSISDRVVVLSQGKIEQVGAPADIYGKPRTVFVAEFIGTMNRIEGTVSRNGAGFVDRDGVRLPVEAARTWPEGERVLLLIRPESITLERMDAASSNGHEALQGKILAHTFLGSVTRLRVESPVGAMSVDVPSVEALALEAGTPVALTWDAGSPGLIRLSKEDQPGTTDRQPEA